MVAEVLHVVGADDGWVAMKVTINPSAKQTARSVARFGGASRRTGNRSIPRRPCKMIGRTPEVPLVEMMPGERHGHHHGARVHCTGRLQNPEFASVGWQRASKVLSLRAIGLHVALICWISLAPSAAWWQVGAAIQGNALSYLYSIEWPLIGLSRRPRLVLDAQHGEDHRAQRAGSSRVRREDARRRSGGARQRAASRGGPLARRLQRPPRATLGRTEKSVSGVTSGGNVPSLSRHVLSSPAPRCSSCSSPCSCTPSISRCGSTSLCSWMCVGIGHGIILYPIYMIMCFNLRHEVSPPPSTSAIMLFAGFVPGLAFYLEHRMRLKLYPQGSSREVSLSGCARRVIAFAHQGGSFEGPSSTLARDRARPRRRARARSNSTCTRPRTAASSSVTTRPSSGPPITTAQSRALTLAELASMDNAYWWIDGDVVTPGRHARGVSPPRPCARADRRYGVATLEEVAVAFPGVLLNLDIKGTIPFVEPYEDAARRRARSSRDLRLGDRRVVSRRCDSALSRTRAGRGDVGGHQRNRWPSTSRTSSGLRSSRPSWPSKCPRATDRSTS